jgi:hypothetical protein
MHFPIIGTESMSCSNVWVWIVVRPAEEFWSRHQCSYMNRKSLSNSASVGAVAMRNL